MSTLSATSNTRSNLKNSYLTKEESEFLAREEDELEKLRSKILSQNDQWMPSTPENETKVLNKTNSSLQNFGQITSHYWKINSTEKDGEAANAFLTSVSSHNDKDLLAISHSSKSSNLLIYDLNVDKMLLAHNQTITLPNIWSMKWLNCVDRSDDINFLISGHTKGYVNLTLIPELDNQDFQSAEIIKRFNHEKQLVDDNNDYKLDINRQAITELELSPKSWRSCNINSLLTIYKENFFMWDSSRSKFPILKNKSKGIKSFDSSPYRDGILGVCGEFGIALHDLRAPDGAPSFFVPSTNSCTIQGKSQQNARYNKSVANKVKWSLFDPNILASSYANGIVRLWDVRKTNDSFAVLEGHEDSTTSIEWSNLKSNELYTGSKDGKIIHWNLADVTYNESCENNLKCTLKSGFNSIKLVKNKRDQIELVEDILNTRQCGTIIPASNTCIVDMVNVNDKILSIDGSSFLGIHTKENNNVDNKMILNSIPESIHEELEQSSLTEDNSSYNSPSSSPRTPQSIPHKYFKNLHNISNETLTDHILLLPKMSSVVSTNYQERAISSSGETLFDVHNSPFSNSKETNSQFFTHPFYEEDHSKTLVSPNDDKVLIMSKKNWFKEGLANLEKGKFLEKLRDISGTTLAEGGNEDLLTDLSIEDDSQFRPVAPLLINKRERQSLY
ncbi:hypothetical protein PACTADRAFT_4100 [Pachysolen tannophilus NRRL Y-2460]|uniref:Uncharacterized protein n=1 Tax=Pachysolen tannophilus NRRL Y-2460 TaxID=669874 RepID=A0A1E4TQY1_PACTA|nr:hypothetical protein PACTADRAFT_4100 [Pachysolen tannophilus NRRL Y-2460]